MQQPLHFWMENRARAGGMLGKFPLPLPTESGWNFQKRISITFCHFKWLLVISVLNTRHSWEPDYLLLHFCVSRFSSSTGLLGMSYAQFKPEQLGKGGGALLKLLQLLKLVTMETGVGENPSTFQVVHKDNDHSCLKWKVCHSECIVAQKGESRISSFGRGII